MATVRRGYRLTVPLSTTIELQYLELQCMCKRGFGSPRIWIPHPKTLADLDDPKRGFGSPADLDPSIYFVCDRLEYNEVEFWEPNPRTPKRGFGSPADLDPDSQRIVEDRFDKYI